MADSVEAELQLRWLTHTGAAAAASNASVILRAAPNVSPSVRRSCSLSRDNSGKSTSSLMKILSYFSSTPAETRNACNSNDEGDAELAEFNRKLDKVLNRCTWK